MLLRLPLRTLNLPCPKKEPWSQCKLNDTFPNSYLLYEYRDLFIDMAVRNNRSELAIANRHQER